MPSILPKTVRRWLYLGHRWLGILTGLFFAAWFGSGVVMIYVGFPALTDAERRAALPPIAWDRVRVTPTQALAAAGQARFPRDLRLAMLDDAPVYRIVAWDGARRTISALDGRPIDAVDAAQALTVAGHDARAVRPRRIGTVERDQWSVTARYDPLRPFHLVALGDDAATNLYVSARSGEIVLDTARTERIWNWFGAIPHWIYLTPLRARPELWRDIVLWVSGASIVTAITGFWAGLLRVRPRRRYRGGALTPYRGWQALHHGAGLIGGLTLIGFIVSGWLSMNPNRWFGPRAPSQAMLERYVGATQPHFDLALGDLAAQSCADAVEVRLGHLGGAPNAVVVCRTGQGGPCCGSDGADLTERAVAAARRLLPDSALSDWTILHDEDAYWYGHRQDGRLPVLRVMFADPQATWFHIDPRTGEILNRADRSARAYRWLFNGLHTLDFGFLVRNGPAREGVLWLLSAAGLILSISGAVIGWRRLRS